MSAHEHHSSIYPDDATLVQAAADGDRTACRLVAMRAYDRVIVLVKSMNVPPEDFEGAVERSLCEILQCIGDYKGPESLEAWSDHLVLSLINGPGRRRPWSKKPPKIDVDKLLEKEAVPVDELHRRRQILDSMARARLALAERPKPKPIRILVAGLIALAASAALVAVSIVNQSDDKTHKAESPKTSPSASTMAMDNEDKSTSCDCACPKKENQIMPGEFQE